MGQKVQTKPIPDVKKKLNLSWTFQKPTGTVKGELRVANFLVNSFKRTPLPDACGCAPLPVVLQGTGVITEWS
jgi:hypothetical protein